MAAWEMTETISSHAINAAAAATTDEARPDASVPAPMRALTHSEQERTPGNAHSPDKAATKTPPGSTTLIGRSAPASGGAPAQAAGRHTMPANAADRKKRQAAKQEPRIKGYFQSQLRAQALAPRVAEPTTIATLLHDLRQYLAADDVATVLRAYEFAERAHEGQYRRTGHQYITHPLAVADILAAMRMDHQSIAAAIMHDVLEDTGVTKETLIAGFGAEVAEIVDGVSKLTTMFKSHAEAQAHNFQKMAMAMARDLRVILVKLADRLHNMRTIGVMAPEKRRRIARETLDFYAPIANRLGMNVVRVELEELAFQALYPLRADRMRRAVAGVRSNSKATMSQLRRTIEASLRREGIDAAVMGSHKHLYSIYRQMKIQRESFQEITAAFGFRMIVDQVDTCYRALGVIHNLYKPVANRFKDYIAIPKANGYQSLHTSLIGMNAVPIDVQIRTRQMDTVAEKGIAGHWLYKHEDASNGSHDRARQWVAGLLDLQQRAGDSLAFIESLRMDLFPDEVYVFTPNADILELPKGACPIDFAYAIHTDVGDHCVACKVDRVVAPLSVPLESGQTVEIITSTHARPSPEWLTFAVSSRARSAIRQALKVQQRSESIRLGRRLLDRSLANADMSIKALDFRRLRRVFRDFDVRKLDDLLAEIGIGNLMAHTVAQRLLAADNPAWETVDLQHGGSVAIHGGEGLVVSYGGCCGPVPGDIVVCHTTPGRGLVVHVERCHNIKELRRRNSKDLVPARWAAHTEGEFETALMIVAHRRKGIISELASAANATDAGIENIVVDERSADLSTVRLKLAVRDRDHLERVRGRLLAIPAVQQVARPVS